MDCPLCVPLVITTISVVIIIRTINIAVIAAIRILTAGGLQQYVTLYVGTLRGACYM